MFRRKISIFLNTSRLTYFKSVMCCP